MEFGISNNLGWSLAVNADRAALIQTDVVESCVRCTVLHFSATNPRSIHTAFLWSIRSALVGPWQCCVGMIRFTNVFKTHTTSPVDISCIVFPLTSISIMHIYRTSSGHIRYDPPFARVRRPRRMSLATGRIILRPLPMYIRRRGGRSVG